MPPLKTVTCAWTCAAISTPCRGNRGGAQYWFARAVAASPSSVFAYADWGSMLLAQGKPDDAIAKFKRANQKGPHFADPLEGGARR